MNTISLNDDEMQRLGALISYLFMVTRFLVDDIKDYPLPLFRLEQIFLDSKDFELLQKIDDQIFK